MKSGTMIRFNESAYCYDDDDGVSAGVLGGPFALPGSLTGFVGFYIMEHGTFNHDDGKREQLLSVYVPAAGQIRHFFRDEFNVVFPEERK